MFTEYTVGGQDGAGRTIGSIIERTGNYVIYRSESAPGILFDGSEQAMANVKELEGDLADLDYLALGLNKIPVNFYKLKADVMKDAAGGNIPQAREKLGRLHSRLFTAQTHTGRLVYILGLLVSLALSMIVYAVLYVLGKSGIFVLSSDSLGLLRALVFGGLGGLLAEIIRAKKLNIKTDSGFWANFTFGFLRIVISYICSVIAFYALQAKLVLGFDMSGSTRYVYTVIYILAGYSQTFIPNLLNALENKSSAKPGAGASGK